MPVTGSRSGGVEGALLEQVVVLAHGQDTIAIPRAELPALLAVVESLMGGGGRVHATLPTAPAPRRVEKRPRRATLSEEAPRSLRVTPKRTADVKLRPAPPAPVVVAAPAAASKAAPAPFPPVSTGDAAIWTACEKWLRHTPRALGFSSLFRLVSRDLAQAGAPSDKDSVKRILGDAENAGALRRNSVGMYRL